MTNTMSCGCEIISDNLGAYKIEYCPKHKATDDMYEALLGLVDYLIYMGVPEDCEDKYEEAREALAKAGERCIP